MLLFMLMRSSIFSGQAQEAEQVVQLEIDTPETANEGPSRDQIDEKSPDQSPDEAANQSSTCLELDQSQEEDDISIQDEPQTKQEDEETEQSTQENLVRAIYYKHNTTLYL